MTSDSTFIEVNKLSDLQPLTLDTKEAVGNSERGQNRTAARFSVGDHVLDGFELQSGRERGPDGERNAERFEANVSERARVKEGGAGRGKSPPERPGGILFACAASRAPLQTSWEPTQI